MFCLKPRICCSAGYHRTSVMMVLTYGVLTVAWQFISLLEVTFLCSIKFSSGQVNSLFPAIVDGVCFCSAWDTIVLNLMKSWHEAGNVTP